MFQNPYQQYIPISFNNARVQDLLNIHLTKNPQSRVQDRKKHFNSFRNTFADASLYHLNTHSLKFWFQHIKKEHDLSDRTLSTIKSDLNSFFKDLIEQNIIKHSPLEKIRFERKPPPRRKRVVLSVNEVLEILKNVKTHSPRLLLPFLFLCAHTGARRAEVLKLKREDVDLSANLIHFRNTKNGEDRAIRMGPLLVSFFSSFLKSHKMSHAVPYLERDEAIPKHIIEKHLKKFKALYSNSKDWGPHSLRHSYAYNFLKKGGNMYQLQAILGHKSINVTIDVYGQLAAQDIENTSPYED